MSATAAFAPTSPRHAATRASVTERSSPRGRPRKLPGFVVEPKVFNDQSRRRYIFRFVAAALADRVSPSLVDVGRARELAELEYESIALGRIPLPERTDAQSARVLELGLLKERIRVRLDQGARAAARAAKREPHDHAAWLADIERRQAGGGGQ